MKLYQYNEFRKLNQALNSFKRNKIPVIKVEILVVKGEIEYFVLTDPKYKPQKIVKFQKKIVKPQKKPKPVVKKDIVKKDKKRSKK